MPGLSAAAPEGRPAGAFDPVSRLLFPAPPASYDEASFPGELIWIPRAPRGKEEERGPTPPEERIPCIFLKYASARFIVFYLHTNAEDLGKCHTFCSCVRAQFQVHVFAVEYPGYGLCPGGPCDEQGLTDNALAALKFIREGLKWPLDSILVLGRSIGCGPAISLAVRYQVCGIVIISPMLSFRELCKDLVGPLAGVVKERFPNMSRMQFVRSSVLLVHGQKDNTVPYRHGLELFQICKARKLFVGPEDMGHNANLFADVGYIVMPMLHFFALPDYCFEEIHVPSWAFDRRAEPFSAAETPKALLGAKPPPQPASLAPAPPRPEAPQPPGAGEGATEQEAALQEGGPRSPSPRQMLPQRPTTIRLPPSTEQERTASRQLLASISDRPLPATHESSLLAPAAVAPPGQAWPREAPLAPPLACCCSCPAAGPEAFDSWEELEGAKLLDPVLLAASSRGQGL